MTPPAPRPAPPWFFALAFLALVGLAVAFERMGRSDWVDEPNDLDVAVHAWVVHHRPDWPGVTLLFRLATLFGNPNVATCATAVVTFGLYAAARMGVSRIPRWEALFWLGAILGGRVLSIVLKWVYRRERPPLVHRLVPESTYSFPSGHSVFAAVFFTMLAVVLLRLLPSRPRWARAGAVAACLALAVTIGVSRVWLGVHYPTDVLGGMILGFGWVGAAALARHGLALRLERPARGA